jgi:hypothetical protein
MISNRFKIATCSLALSMAIANASTGNTTPISSTTGAPTSAYAISEVANSTTNNLTDAQTKAIVAKLTPIAAQQMSQPLVPYGLVGPDMIPPVRTVLYRVHLYSLLYQLTGNSTYAAHARSEMLNAAAWPDWNPAHMLDTAEMSRAIANGLDWLGTYLSTTDQQTLRSALYTHGVQGFLNNQNVNGGWGYMSCSNWNAVVATGISIAAYESMSQNPTVCTNTLNYLAPSLQSWLKQMNKDGSYVEGPNYLGFALNYVSAYMEFFKGTKYEISPSSLPASITNALEFRRNLSMPAGLFNFGDNTQIEESTPYLSFLGSQLGLQDVANFQYARLSGAWLTPVSSTGQEPVDVMWSPQIAAGATVQQSAYNPITTYPSLGLGILRSNSTVTGLAIGGKAGQNNGYHAHLDLGTFVADALGQRWAINLGPDLYALPNYFTPPLNAAYYRISTHGQNTLCFNNANQDGGGTGTISSSWGRADSNGFVLSLDLANRTQASSWQRAFVTVPSGYAVIQDEFTCLAPQTPVSWVMHTNASISINSAGNIATLTQAGKTVNFQILSPAGATWHTESAYQPAPQNANTGVTRLVSSIKAGMTKTTFSVAVIPQVAGSNPTVQLRSISAWATTPNP